MIVKNLKCAICGIEELYVTATGWIKIKKLNQGYPNHEEPCWACWYKDHICPKCLKTIKQFKLDKDSK